MTEFTPWSSLIGGVILGTGALLLLIGNGRIAGISGISAGLLARFSQEWLWRFVFVVGLITGPLVAALLGYGLPDIAPINTVLVVISGLLVGVGTRLGSGCTSGHGICGLGRLSKRSMVATLVFMSVAVATVFVAQIL
ncbi:YeeE/YedE family protein [Echinimonas agarilytica]|uniref:YeeE/YedE family protein n=1 Tax=Echinimonas agarilytica TaxID=1215918 RepID=A0AA42B660_9GAMM|nr:YeeE/YedE family protein [Echinimonas agarilytica]MCM2678355.1 YeeE/YedE family protein [Echinimonas agarilytica]